MCSSDKQNMDVKIENPVLQFFSWVLNNIENKITELKKKRKESKNKRTEFRNKTTELENKRTEFENKRKELKELVEKEGDFIHNGECIGELIEAEKCLDAINYLLHNKLVGDKDLDQFFEQLEKVIGKRSTNQSSGLGKVKRCVLLLPYFDEDFVFNLKRVTRLSVPHEVIPENLEKLQNFLQLNANGREKIQNFPEWDNFSRIPCLEVIEGEQKKDSDSFPNLPIFKVVTNISDLAGFEKLEFMLLRYLSLRVNLTKEKNLNLKKLSSLKYLDLKHTKVKDCSWLIHLEKLQMLDLRYTYVEKIPDNILEKLGKLQHLLLGYIKGGEKVEPDKLNVKIQLAGTKLNVKKLNLENLKTLRAIEMPNSIKDISDVRNVVDLSVTGLTTDSLKTFWDTLEEFHKLTSLGVAVTHLSIITLPDCKDKLKENLKRLRMEGSHSGLEKLGQFGKLNDLTLANMGIEIIPDLPELLCLRLYGVCQNATYKIEWKSFRKLEKLVIGDMGMVEIVQISSAVLETVVTLKFSNLPKLKQVAYTDEHPDKHHSLLRWANSEAQECSGDVKPNKTIFLRHFEVFPVNKSPGLEIYRYNMKMQCYELNATQNNQG
ncbi:uncharacterized protein LOC144560730 [Carex rostrata]